MWVAVIYRMLAKSKLSSAEIRTLHLGPQPGPNADLPRPGPVAAT